MADRDRRRERRDEERDRYFERNQRWIGSGYWTNEPGFQEARRRAPEGDQENARDYDDEDVHRYRRDSVEQGERIRGARGPYENERDQFENNEYYANRGWSRSAAVETDRDWAFNNNQDFSRDDRLEIDFYRGSTDREFRNEREFGSGIDAMRGKTRNRDSETPLDRGSRSDPDLWGTLGNEDERDRIERHNRREEEWRRQGGERGGERRQEWDVPGPYSGIGPQGYQRTDERINEEVCEHLTRHSHIDAREVEIEVENGEVTLRGKVQDRHQKRLAEDIAASISGVKDVQNELRVSPPGDRGMNQK